MLTGMTERDWLIVLEVFDAAQSSRGEPGHDDRKFLEAVHYFTVHSITWRALPSEYGKWNSVWKRFWRLSRSGVFEAFFQMRADQSLLGRGVPVLLAGSGFPRDANSQRGEGRTRPATQGIVVLEAVVHKFLWRSRFVLLSPASNPRYRMLRSKWSRGHKMEWSEDIIVRLRGLWDEGHSTAEIGRRLGISKNAVVGKAHRLDLPARPSPIRRDGSSQPRPRRPRVPRVAGPTLPPLASTRAPAPAFGGTLRPALSAPAPRPQPVPPPRYGRVITCCWPIGEPGTRDFHFCDAASVPGKPYCEQHAEVAYVKIRDKRDDAA